eukprot:9713362-Lingulodinium_polyedra.AAC.1
MAEDHQPMPQRRTSNFRAARVSHGRLRAPQLVCRFSERRRLFSYPRGRKGICCLQVPIDRSSFLL